MVTADGVIERLRGVHDPEVGVNIVDLGLVYGVNVEDSAVFVLMTLTSPGCPLGDTVEESVRRALESVPGVEEVQLRLTFEPPWGPERMSRAALTALGWPADD
jgi:metal-sulfur cluster biosynthetic enzyme